MTVRATHQDRPLRRFHC